MVDALAFATTIIVESACASTTRYMNKMRGQIWQGALKGLRTPIGYVAGGLVTPIAFVEHRGCGESLNAETKPSLKDPLSAFALSVHPGKSRSAAAESAQLTLETLSSASLKFQVLNFALFRSLPSTPRRR